ncbi:MAG TPA: 3-methyl-2-oxobutanoate hydroxymethyltransferase [Armatimonadota bacterium]|nr:3-methyl-2-oxobutanoate hydroxymethyltransferase [Armatimonadota bacterium]
MSKDKVTTVSLLEKKQKGEKITALTAYDYSTAKLLNEAGVDIALVGDSLGMVVLGYETTLPVTMEDMLHHTAAVVRGVQRAMVVADMPFMSYQISPEQAMANAGRFLQEAGAHAVKLEGGRPMVETIRRIVDVGIPVLGHLGYTPQSVHKFGGPRIQGKTESDAQRILNDARALEQAGVFAIVLELVPKELAKRVTESVSIPTIGIGAGPDCDGQVLVTNDLLGLYGEFHPRHAKKYANLSEVILAAMKSYVEEVKSGEFPGPEHGF